MAILPCGPGHRPNGAHPLVCVVSLPQEFLRGQWFFKQPLE
jgi:hypothetical protein